MCIAVCMGMSVGVCISVCVSACIGAGVCVCDVCRCVCWWGSMQPTVCVRRSAHNFQNGIELRSLGLLARVIMLALKLRELGAMVGL